MLMPIRRRYVVTKTEISHIVPLADASGKVVIQWGDSSIVPLLHKRSLEVALCVPSVHCRAPPAP